MPALYTDTFRILTESLNNNKNKITVKDTIITIV